MRSVSGSGHCIPWNGGLEFDWGRSSCTSFEISCL